MPVIAKSLPILFTLLAAITFYSGTFSDSENKENRFICTAVKLYDNKLVPEEDNSQPDKNLLNEFFHSAARFSRNESETNSGNVKEFLSPETAGYPLCINDNFFGTTKKLNVFLLEISIVTVSNRDGPTA